MSCSEPARTACKRCRIRRLRRTQLLAFPGAEGFGRYAIGGRGGQVVHVTSLEDDGTEGTLRWALETVTGPRTVVFDVSGIITINKRLTVNEPYVTIAGQTAPGDGILVRGHGMSLHSEGITRFILHRMGSVINEEDGSAIYANQNVQSLAEFYLNNLVRKDVVTQTSTEEGGTEYLLPKWDKKLYLMGLRNSDESNNPNVVQTIGWNSTFGGMGVFDPLSDNPVTQR